MEEIYTNNYPLFSIIVPIYNVEKYLKECIESLVRQTFQNFEIILVNDGSTDASGQICEFYKQKYRNVKVVHKENEGLVRARDTGLKIAEGKYIGFVDADDWVECSLLEYVNKVIEEYAPEIISYNLFLEYLNKREEQPLLIKKGFYDKELMKKEIYPIMLYDESENFYNFGVYPSVWNKFFLKYLLENNKCKDTRITMGEDAVCTYGCLLEAKSLYVMEEYLYHYRQNQESMTNNYDETRFEKYKILLEYLDKKFLGMPYNLEKQLKAHKAFRVKHAILNESKAPVSFFKKAKILKRKMKEYNFEYAFIETGKIKLGATSKVFVFLAKHKMYKSLILMCEIFKKVKKSN